MDYRNLLKPAVLIGIRAVVDHALPAECRIIVDFTEARDDGVAVASAGPYANNLHLASDR